jgi:periplasmic protein TonB
MPFRLDPERLIGVCVVLALHAVVLWGLWSYRMIPAPVEAVTLFVNFIAPPAPQRNDTPRQTPPKPRPAAKEQPRQMVAQTPKVEANDYVAPPPPPPAPVQAAVAEAPPMPLPAGPVNLSSELAVSCPDRRAPVYPPVSRRTGETGTVVLRVELDENGRVASARVATSSGYSRLDEAALTAVQTWHCTPPQRNGKPVRALALQPFRFVLEGS